MLRQQGTFKENLEIAKQVADHAPFGEWLKSSHRLSEITQSEWLDEPLMAAADVLKLQAANGEPVTPTASFSFALTSLQSSCLVAWFAVSMLQACTPGNSGVA